MKKPITNFLQDYKDTLRLHMPGHAGKSGADDITEVFGADSLYHTSGIIAESESIAARLYGGGAALFSAGGATLCVQAMVAAAQGKIAADRGCHVSFANACALWGRDVHWITPSVGSETGLTAPVTAEQVVAALRSDKSIKSVFITGITYYGLTADVKSISDVCVEYGAKLFVDNAHGAHLAVSGNHPIQKGADFCCDSAHKTLNSLTGAAILHLKDAVFYRRIKSLMSLFGSTSPSYPILASIESGVEFLFENPQLYRNNILRFRPVLDSSPFDWESFDCMKIIINANSAGYTCQELARHLRCHKIEPEFTDGKYVLLICSPLLEDDVCGKLADSLKLTPGKPIAGMKIKKLSVPVKNMALYDAVRTENEYTGTENALGRICAENLSVCPPGSLLVAAGELLNEQTITVLKKNNIKRIKAVCV
ncbi:MAG: hypothetical protein FWG69_05695 [Oscillospiraceae bacterium]|nr:hypothetical protein [Oscillospiraceae bacterium]